MKSDLLVQSNEPLSILVVEDSLIAQQAIRHLLTIQGAKVNLVDNGAQALQKIQVKDYALIVIDLDLPDYNGCTLACLIRYLQQQQRRPLSVLIALSARMDAVNRQRCLEAGMSEAFAKPLTMRTISVLLALAEGRVCSA